jgi:hypothetical protein
MIATEQEILQKGIDALAEIGLHITKCEPIRDRWADYTLELRTNKDKKTHPFLVEIKKDINNANLSQWILGLKIKNKPTNNLALLTRYISPSIGEKLREMEISYFDTAGNAYFNDPSFYIYVTGKKPKDLKPKTISLFRPAGIKLLLHLLNEQGLEEHDYRDLAQITGIPKTTIGELMNDLERLQFLTFCKNKRRLTNKPELLKRWVEAFTESYRPKLVRGRFRAPEGKTEWWETASAIQYQACWGGEIAAQKLVGHIKPKVVTIYADSLLPRLQAKYSLRRDQNGDIEILKKFWTGELDNIAPLLVVYADLISTADTRNLETARIIYEKYLARLIEDSPE